MTSIHLVPTEVLRARLRDVRAAQRALEEQADRLVAAIAAREPAPRRALTRDGQPVRHGTEAGYRAHAKRWGTPACDRCKKAHAAHHRRQRGEAVNDS